MSHDLLCGTQYVLTLWQAKSKFFVFEKIFFPFLSNCFFLWALFITFFSPSSPSITVLVNFNAPPPSNSFQIFHTGARGLSSNGSFKGKTTNTISLEKRGKQSKISDFQNDFRIGNAVWVQGGGGIKVTKNGNPQVWKLSLFFFPTIPSLTSTMSLRFVISLKRSKKST